MTGWDWERDWGLSVNVSEGSYWRDENVLKQGDGDDASLHKVAKSY